MNIILTGMSGAGKSTLGVLLAKTLGMDFVDTDILIQRLQNGLLQDILDCGGIEKFLEIEENIITGMKAENAVVATGGSVVYSEKAMRVLKRDGLVIYLHVPYEEIRKRLDNITARGIVMKKGYGLRDVYDERIPLYVKYSDITFDCSGRDIETCVGELAEEIRGFLERMPGKDL